MLIEARKAGKLGTSGDGPSKGADGHDTLTLADLNITRDESARAQELAAVPLAEFEKWIANLSGRGLQSIGFAFDDDSASRKRSV
jgi:hypothetical protein